MNTSLTHSSTKVVRTIADAEHVEERIHTSAGDTRLTLGLDLSTLKSKESLQHQIDGLWKTFCEQALSLISDLYSSETTGQPTDTQNGTLTGPSVMAANRHSVKYRKIG